ncbi:MAG: alpha/beta hydrolase, partial [Kutzneria sp.]|nr:alpha/beta hydrolase [Kutzneria sp.]
EGLPEMLDECGRARTAEARGERPRLERIVPDNDEELAAARDLPAFAREAYDYYRTPRGQHPNSTNRFLFRSIDQIAQFSPYTLNHLIAPRPLLMVAGTAADTAPFSQEAIERAAEPKELFWVEGATHVGLYDRPEYVPGVVAKLAEFFQKNLATA